MNIEDGQLTEHEQEGLTVEVDCRAHSLLVDKQHQGENLEDVEQVRWSSFDDLGQQEQQHVVGQGLYSLVLQSLGDNVILEHPQHLHKEMSSRLCSQPLPKSDNNLIRHEQAHKLNAVLVGQVGKQVLLGQKLDVESVFEVDQPCQQPDLCDNCLAEGQRGAPADYAVGGQHLKVVVDHAGLGDVVQGSEGQLEILVGYHFQEDDAVVQGQDLEHCGGQLQHGRRAGLVKDAQKGLENGVEPDRQGRDHKFRLVSDAADEGWQGVNGG